jgi:hypothetical protein
VHLGVIFSRIIVRKEYIWQISILLQHD